MKTIYEGEVHEFLGPEDIVYYLITMVEFLSGVPECL
jgi:hypothetical protein